MFQKLIKLSLLPFAFMLTSCTVSPQQAFQNAKLTLVDEIKIHFLAKDETLADVDYGEMQYILLNKSGNETTFPANRYYYTGKITLTVSGDKKTRTINPTTYYDLTTKKGGVFDVSIKSFEVLKELVDAGSEYSGSQGTFFPSNY